MSIIDDFIDNSRKFFEKIANRLNNELAFVNSISTEQSRLQDNIVNRLSDDGLPGTGIPGINSQLETLGIVDSIAGAPDIAQSTRDLTGLAMGSILNPTQVLSLSGALNTSAGEFISSLIPADNLAFGPDFSFSNVIDTVVGDHNAVSQIPISLADVTQQAFIQTLNTISMTYVTTPETLFGTYGISIGGLSVGATLQGSKLDEIIALEAEILVLVESLTDEFYATAKFDLVEESIGDLETADSFLTNVRSQMISLGIFAESQFINAQSKVNDAQEALGFDITTSPRILEINSKLDRLEQLLSEVEGGVNEIVEVNANLDGAIDDLLAARAFGMLFAGQVNQIQVEIRSLILSMTAAIAVNRVALVVPLMAIWRTQLVLLAQVMAGLPEEIKQYLGTDPQGFRADFDVTVDALALLGDTGVDILVSQGKAFVRTVRQALGNEAFLAAISTLGPAMVIAANKVKGFVDSVKTIADAHINPPDEVTDLSKEITGLLNAQGLDRAEDFLQKGDILGLLTMSRESATYSGQTLKSINDIIACLEREPKGTIDVTGLNIVKRIQDFFANVQRAESLLATTFAQFKGLARQRVQKVDLPAVRKTKSLVDRVEEQLRQSGCAEIL